MATKINLLPRDLGPGSEVVKIARVFNRLAILAGVLFLLVGVLAAVYLIFQTNQLSLANGRMDALKQKITSLASVEQKLFLVKDRAQKAKTIFSDKSAQLGFSKLGTFLSSAPSDVVIDSADVDINSAHFSVISKSSLSMASFLNSLTTTSGFKQVSLKNFSFIPGNGYKITLEVF